MARKSGTPGTGDAVGGRPAEAEERGAGISAGGSLLCFPTDRAAYGRLAQLISKGQRRVEKGLAALWLEDVLEHAEGQILIALPPPVPDPAFERFLAALRSAAPGRTYLAAQFLYRGDDRARIERLAELADRHGTPLVATGDVLYHTPERRPLQDVLACIREKCTIDDAGLRLLANAERHLKPADEMVRLFRYWPDAVARTAEIVRACRFSLDELAYDYPIDAPPDGLTVQGWLERLTLEGAAERYPDGQPDKVRDLIRHELELIEELDYAPYFLTVYDIVRYARSRGILCQGRGSAANSAVCYCLGITAVDPGRFDLLFERFVSAERGEPPDIDVDFEHERREEVIQYIYEKYGREHAGIAATVIHYRTRSAIREVGKALGLSADVVGGLAGSIWGWSNDGVAGRDLEERGLDPEEPRIALAVRLSRELIGFPRHLSQHVGGFVLTRSRLDQVVPVVNGAMPERTFVEWDKDDLDALGILKIDVLGLGMLTCIRKAFELLEAHYGHRIGLASVPPEDPAVYEMLGRGDSIGVFQVESRAQMTMLPRLKPTCFYDLIVEVAIVRPGPIQGDMVHPYLRRRAGLEPVSYPSDELKGVLEKTLGVPLFQEQAMKIAIIGAGFTASESDRLRRAMATFKRVGTIDRLGARFIEGMVGNGYEREFAEKCFRQIEGFGTYGFPESHAASFALLVYVSAWIKCHYPEVFAAALLNSQPMGFYAPAQIVRDARGHGVTVLPVDVDASDWDATLEVAAPRAPVTTTSSGVGAAHRHSLGHESFSFPPEGRPNPASIPLSLQGSPRFDSLSPEGGPRFDLLSLEEGSRLDPLFIEGGPVSTPSPLIRERDGVRVVHGHADHTLSESALAPVDPSTTSRGHPEPGPSDPGIPRTTPSLAGRTDSDLNLRPGRTPPDGNQRMIDADAGMHRFGQVAGPSADRARPPEAWIEDPFRHHAASGGEPCLEPAAVHPAARARPPEPRLPEDPHRHVVSGHHPTGAGETTAASVNSLVTPFEDPGRGPCDPGNPCATGRSGSGGRAAGQNVTRQRSGTDGFAARNSCDTGSDHADSDGAGTGRWSSERMPPEPVPHSSGREAGGTDEEAGRPASGGEQVARHRPEGGSARRFALRLGFRQVKGLKEEEMRRLTDARGAGYHDLADLRARARIGQGALDRLARADAFGSMRLDRRGAIWTAIGLDRTGRELDPPPLFAWAEAASAGVEPGVDLPPMSTGQHVAEDYRTLRLTLRTHPLALLRPRLPKRTIRAEELARIDDGRWVEAAGLVLVRQRPGTASGVIFVTLEDETGVINLVVWPKVFERFRRVVLGAQMMTVQGKVQKEGLVIHVVAGHLADRTDLLRGLSSAELEAPVARADRVKPPNDRRARPSKAPPFDATLAHADHGKSSGGPDPRDPLWRPRDIDHYRSHPHLVPAPFARADEVKRNTRNTKPSPDERRHPDQDAKVKGFKSRDFH